jgi:hypothetical protein
MLDASTHVDSEAGEPEIPFTGAVGLGTGGSTRSAMTREIVPGLMCPGPDASPSAPAPSGPTACGSRRSARAASRAPQAGSSPVGPCGSSPPSTDSAPAPLSPVPRPSALTDHPSTPAASRSAALRASAFFSHPHYPPLAELGG